MFAELGIPAGSNAAEEEPQQAVNEKRKKKKEKKAQGAEGSEAPAQQEAQAEPEEEHLDENGEALDPAAVRAGLA